MKIFTIVLVAITLLAGCDVSFNSGNENTGKVEAGTPAQQRAVEEAAINFLKQLDAGKIEVTWRKTSPYLHELSNQTAWSVTLHTLRDTVGEYKDRTLKGIGFTHTLKGVPNGDYATVVFDTAFTNASVMEKVVLQNDHGTWKVLGYFLIKRVELTSTPNTPFNLTAPDGASG